MINLGDKKWGVKDSGLLAYKQVGSKFFNKDFDFTRSSDATYIDKNGVLQTQSLYNLLDYSQDFSQWLIRALDSVNENIVISPNGTLNGSSLIEDNTSNFHWVQNIVSITPSSTTTISVFAKAKDTRNLFIRSYDSAANIKVSQFNILDGTIISTDSGSTSEIEDYGNGWYRCSQTREDISGGGSITCQIGILNGASISYQGDGVSGLYIYGAQLVEGTEPLNYQYTNGRVGIPRIDFSDGVGSLLLEPQRSNLLLQSNSFDTTWISNNTTETSGESGVYGTNDAWLVSKSATGGRIYQTISSSGVQTSSVYAKANTANWIILEMAGIGYTSFDLVNGSLGNNIGGIIDSNIVSIGNGWYRVAISFNGATSGFRIYPAEGDNVTSGTSGSIYIQHAQLESGSYPTSIIETTTSAVTRIADVANNCGSEQDFNSEEGVLYVELKLDTNALQNQYSMISIGDALNNRVQLTFIQNSNDFSAIVGSSIGTRELLFPFNYGSYNKIALKYDSSGFKVFHNGVFVGNNTYAISGLDLQTLQFRFPTGTQYDFYGKVRSVKYFPTALTDEELENLTT